MVSKIELKRWGNFDNGNSNIWKKLFKTNAIDLGIKYSSGNTVITKSKKSKSTVKQFNAHNADCLSHSRKKRMTVS